ncbi:unnamed protein product [Prunus armeniaca]|uniref:Transmembrane protein n=1 Tax=Prunus armeniaca TaxID=36596 RepID=A0A6J5UBQ1_PRUAR|nr:unnamed protein product [Prunus armeniaca]
MARPLAPSFSMASHHLFQHPSHFLFAPIVIFSMISLLIFLCASHKSKKSNEKKEEAITNSESKDAKFIAKLNSKISSKALAMAKMVSWRKMEAGEEDQKDDDDDDHSDEAVWRKSIIMGERCTPLNDDDDDDDDDRDEAVWRKSIIMGERCAPLNFSGKIDYDSEGNLVPESPDRNH